MQVKKKLKDIITKPENIIVILIFTLLGVVISYSYFSKVKTLKKDGSKEFIYSGKLILSKTTVEKLDQIPKISKKIAIKIYKNRDNIKNYTDFLKIKGIGKKKLEILKNYILIK